MDHPVLVSPEVAAVQVAEREPDAGMNRGVIRAVLTLNWWVISGNLLTSGRMHVGEVGPRDRFVAKHIRSDRLAGARDDQAITLLFNCETHLRSTAIGCVQRRNDE
jgi:hypothetical protein